MPSQDWSRIIAASVLPDALISACGLMCLAFYNRLAAVVSRLRAFQRERLEHCRCIGEHAGDGADADADAEADAGVRRETLGVLEQQTASVTRRARLLRRTL